MMSEIIEILQELKDSKLVQLRGNSVEFRLNDNSITFFEELLIYIRKNDKEHFINLMFTEVNDSTIDCYELELKNIEFQELRNNWKAYISPKLESSEIISIEHYYLITEGIIHNQFNLLFLFKDGNQMFIRPKGSIPMIDVTFGVNLQKLISKDYCVTKLI